MQESIVFSDDEILLIYKKIGKNVKKFREEKGISQLKLSNAIGYSSVSLVSAAELTVNGKHFNIEHIYKIAKILDKDICDFLK